MTIWISGYEQCRDGEPVELREESEGNPFFGHVMTFVNHGGPQPNGDCRVVSPLPFPAFSFEWLKTDEFPIQVRVRMDSRYFANPAYEVNPEWVKDTTAYMSEIGWKHYSIPLEFWVGGKKTTFVMVFDIRYHRELTAEQKKLLAGQEKFTRIVMGWEKRDKSKLNLFMGLNYYWYLWSNYIKYKIEGWLK